MSETLNVCTMNLLQMLAISSRSRYISSARCRTLEAFAAGVLEPFKDEGTVALKDMTSTTLE